LLRQTTQFAEKSSSVLAALFASVMPKISCTSHLHYDDSKNREKSHALSPERSSTGRWTAVQQCGRGRATFESQYASACVSCLALYPGHLCSPCLPPIECFLPLAFVPWQKNLTPKFLSTIPRRLTPDLLKAMFMLLKHQSVETLKCWRNSLQSC
jgi:hypothetical protein